MELASSAWHPPHSVLRRCVSGCRSETHEEGVGIFADLNWVRHAPVSYIQSASTSMRMCLPSVVVPQLGQVVAPLPVDGASPTRLQVPPATEVSKSLAQPTPMAAGETIFLCLRQRVAERLCFRPRVTAGRLPCRLVRRRSKMSFMIMSRSLEDTESTSRTVVCALHLSDDFARGV
jgi:hypothetical protein